MSKSRIRCLFASLATKSLEPSLVVQTRSARPNLLQRCTSRSLRHNSTKSKSISQASATTTSSTAARTPATLTDQEYYTLSTDSLTFLLTRLEAVAELNPDVDVEYSDGVMNVAIGEAGTYVINRQPPSKQIWLSSPVSGPKRFDYYPGDGWIYKDGTRLKELLEFEWKEEGVEIDLSDLGVA